MEVQPQEAVARLVLCVSARAVTLRRIGVAGVFAEITTGRTFNL